MPRARLLKPGFFKNEELARLSERHRLLYAGLWTLADREGRLEDRPERIKGELFPYEADIDVNALLTDLQHAGFIVRYTYGDNSTSSKSHDRSHAIAIPTFSHHQHPHQRETPSVIPPPTSKRSRLLLTTEGKAAPRHRPGIAKEAPSPPCIFNPCTDPVPKDKSSAAVASRRLPAPENPKDNINVITKLVHDAIGVLGTTSLSDLTEYVKGRCAELRITYDSLVVKKAIDSAQFQRQHKVPVEAR